MQQNQPDAISVDVGARIREIRQSRELSMRELARLSGLSANALSLIERGENSPSVSTLYKLSQALGIPITTFFQTQPEVGKVVFRKAEERTRVPFMRGLWEGLGGEDFADRVEPFALTLDNGANSGPSDIEHSGHEFVICLRGQLEYKIEDRTYLLESGDVLLFQAHLKHRWRNPGPMVTNVVFVLSGFDEGEQLQHHIVSEV
ncbi:MAG: helix-turn-helix domain-containing protein [Anaerolineales bacterium]|jgi:transcriptional regulator with XRE-family HTH domain